MQQRTLPMIAVIAMSLLHGPWALSAQNTVTEQSIPLFSPRGDEMKQLQVTSTDTVKFAPGGLVQISGSYGDLAVEGWERPEVEVTVSKALSYGFKEDQSRLEGVTVVTKRHSDSELSIATITPSPNRFVHPFGGKGNGVAIEYIIRIPRNSRLMIHHGVGIVSVRDVTGDIEATCSRGDILLWLPGPGPFALDAKSKFGNVSSDFAGDASLALYRMGERFVVPNAPASPRIHLRMGFGGIAIKRTPAEARR